MDKLTILTTFLSMVCSIPMKLSEDLYAYLESHQVEAQRRLLTWFAENARDLPWRHDRTPYRVWVSEVMLQQTQVKTVQAYYPRFLARFPTLPALAKASLEDVLKVWEGLGYYSRARSLHRAAKLVVEQHVGALPADVQALRALPGIGAYTAGAVASIAFGIPTPAVDGNVRRVMARILALSTPTRTQLEEGVQMWIPEAHPGRFNEALMELGAVVCRAQSPHCLLCPWQEFCKACQLGSQETFPAPKPRKSIPHYDVAAAVIVRKDGRILLARRRLEDMLGGLWEFPGGKRERGETLETALKRELQEEMDIEIEVGTHLTTLSHAYTHFRITLYAFESRLVRGTPQCIECDEFRWATLEDINELPMAVTDRKIAYVIQKD
jgi:A/G-specific adenine glycosylase